MLALVTILFSRAKVLVQYWYKALFYYFHFFCEIIWNLDQEFRRRCLLTIFQFLALVLIFLQSIKVCVIW